MEGLSNQQRSIVHCNHKIIMVIAGPGSGKTRVLTHKVKQALKYGASDNSILLLTFTNKAARNMIERIELILGRKTNIMGGTFHHVANRFLREYVMQIGGFNKHYSIIDESDSARLIKKIINEHFKAQSESIPKPKQLQRIFSYCRNSITKFSDYLNSSMPSYVGQTKVVQEIYDAYARRKKRSNVMDFDDLLTFFNALLDDEKVGEKIRKRFGHIFIDEFQDTSRLQFDIVKKLYSKDSNLFTVGDDCQSIYSFRAANVRNMLDFTNTFANAKLFYLTENYRSTPEIVSLVNSIIKWNRHRFKKDLKSANRLGKGLPKLSLLSSSKEEARFVASEVEGLLERGIKPAQVAVLYRSNFQAAHVEMEFAKKGIMYIKLGGLKFFEQAHIKDVMAFLKAANGMIDEISLERLLKLLDGIGDKTASKIAANIMASSDPFVQMKEIGEPRAIPLNDLFRTVSSQKNPSELITFFIDNFYKKYVKHKYGGEEADERLSDVEQLACIAHEYSSMEEFLEDSMLDANLAGARDSKDRITVSTIHQAKGLEWDYVFLIGCVQGEFPSKYSLGSNERIEEERRLFYVACSRAAQSLTLCIPSGNAWRENRVRAPSQFVQEIDENCYTIVYGSSDSDFVCADKLV